MPNFYSQFIEQLKQLRNMIKSSDKDMFEDEIKGIVEKVKSDDRLSAEERNEALVICYEILKKFQ